MFIQVTKNSGLPERASVRGVFLRELIAAGVRLTGGDIISFAKRYIRVSTDWRPPRGWSMEKISLPDGASASYLIPKGCTRRDVAILHLHGGGYTLGFLPVFKRFALKLAMLGGCVPVLSLDYRVAPEHPYPAALEDAFNAVVWLAENKGVEPGRIIAVGESCGAGMAIALAMRLRDSGVGKLRALALMSPWADLTCSGASYASRYHLDPWFGRRLPVPDDEYRTSVGKIYGNGSDLTHPYLSPAFGDYSGMPPMLIHVGEYEMLFDDSATVCRKAKEKGVEVEFHVWPGMYHVFQIADGFVPEAHSAWREIGVFIRRCFQNTANDH
jgi:acetyl esterase/lipase